MVAPPMLAIVLRCLAYYVVDPRLRIDRSIAAG
jgi:hypothetical protein